ncbi:MAG: hypothetical protein LBU87_00830 [Lactobacillales bacterium]|jgi:hypothetical protein|nr:hypothetical protein [Lactobacillales bacterium]
MKNLKRTIIIGIIWGAIFFLWWLDGFLLENWNFRLFSYKSWHFLIQEFLAGWIIESTSDWIFILTLVVCIPFFLYGWRLLVKVQWTKSFGKMLKDFYYSLKKAIFPRAKIKIKPKQSHKIVRPRPLNTTGRPLAEAEDAKAKSKLEKEKSAPKMDEWSPYSQKTSPASMPAFDLPDDLKSLGASNSEWDDFSPSKPAAVVEDIPGILIKAGYKVIKDVKMKLIDIDFFAVSQEKIILCVLDKEAGDWLADEEKFNGEDPLWFSESSHRVSPIFKLLSETQTIGGKISKMGYMQQIVPLFIEQKGTIINAEDMAAAWQGLSVIVARTDVGGPETIPVFEKALPAAGAAVSKEDFEGIHALL